MAWQKAAKVSEARAYARLLGFRKCSAAHLGAGDEEKYLRRCRRVGGKKREKKREGTRRSCALGREYGEVEIELASIGEAPRRSERARV